MQKTKLIIAITAIAALTLAAVGLAAAQIAQNQTQTYTSTQAPPTGAVPGQGFWGWISNCFGYRTAQPYQGQYIAPPAATTNGTVPQPAPYAPYQGSYGYGYGNGYGYGYGYGPCMGGW